MSLHVVVLFYCVRIRRAVRGGCSRVRLRNEGSWERSPKNGKRTYMHRAGGMPRNTVYTAHEQQSPNQAVNVNVHVYM